MKKVLLLALLSISLGSCGFNFEDDPTVSVKDIMIMDYLELNDSTGNQIVGSIMQPNENYKYLYELDNGMWVASNSQWTIGDHVKLLPIKSNEQDEIRREESSKNQRKEREGE